jgi:RNA polymerase sigma-70 factor (ECF subfamily)
MTDETLHSRAISPPGSVEDTVFDSERNKQLCRAIAKLPEIQRRRFVLYHEFGLTYEQIAEVEGAKRQPITCSIKRAEEKIRLSMKNFKN